MQWGYLVGICLGIAGVATLDWRYKLAYWHNRRRTVQTIAAATALFIVWDSLAIMFGIFHHGSSPYQFHWTLFPQFPIEEVFFLVLLSYTTLVVSIGVARWRSPTLR